MKYRQPYPHTCTGDCDPGHAPHLQIAADLMQAERHRDTRTSAQLWETNGKEACIHALHIAAHHPDRLPHPNRPTAAPQADQARPTKATQGETDPTHTQAGTSQHRNQRTGRQTRHRPQADRGRDSQATQQQNPQRGAQQQNPPKGAQQQNPPKGAQQQNPQRGAQQQNSQRGSQQQNSPKGAQQGQNANRRHQQPRPNQGHQQKTRQASPNQGRPPRQ